ncbi:MAG: transcriptional regulator [Planctomycetes bacterium]|nr:transcriptional regulator [Planctomycetota bacterium]
MARTPQPTDAELRLLKVLWERGGSTARAVLEALPARRKVGYTTVLKILQVMEEKGLVSVDRGARSHVYSPRAGRGPTMRRLVADFVQRTFDGATDEMLVHLVDGRALDDAALNELEARVAALRGREEDR